MGPLGRRAAVHAGHGSSANLGSASGAWHVAQDGASGDERAPHPPQNTAGIAIMHDGHGASARPGLPQK
jgi:hypothetical protein